MVQVAYPFAPVGRDAVGGAEQVLSRLDEALTSGGHRSIVIAQEGSAVSGELVPTPARPGSIDDAAREQAWSEYRRAIEGVLERTRVDLVHMHGVDFWAYLPERARTLVTLHLPLSFYPPAIWAPRPNVSMHCVSSSQAMAAPRNAPLLDPIPNGAPVDALAARHAKRPFALVLGRICPEKGIHLALQAAKLAGRPLLVAGKTFPYEAHERYFADEVAPRLDNLRRFLGPIGFERKRRLLTAASCLLMPSLVAETSSLVAMEALACGAPVIAFPNGALPEIIEHGRTGFLVNTVEEMAAAMGRVGALDPDECRAEARERFSLSAMIARYMDLYQRIAIKDDFVFVPILKAS